MPDFNSWSPVTLVLLGVVVGVFLSMVVAGFTAWLVGRLSGRTRLSDALDDELPTFFEREGTPARVTKNLRETVKPELIKIQTAAKSVGSVSVGVRKAPAPTLHPAEEAKVREVLPPLPAVSSTPKHRLPNAPSYIYRATGIEGTFNTLRDVMTVACPGDLAKVKGHLAWANLNKYVQSLITRERVS